MPTETIIDISPITCTVLASNVKQRIDVRKVEAAAIDNVTDTTDTSIPTGGGKVTLPGDIEPPIEEPPLEPPIDEPEVIPDTVNIVANMEIEVVYTGEIKQKQ